MSQTTVTQNPAVAFPGMPADSAMLKDDLSKITETVLVGGIAPGLGVIRGTDPDTQVQEPQGVTFDATAFVGVSIRTHKARSDFSATDAENYLDEERMAVRRKGRIWVTVEDAFTAGDAAFCRFVAGGGGSVLGAWRTDADTASAVAVTGARFVTSGGAGDLGLLELNP